MPDHWRLDRPNGRVSQPRVLVDPLDVVALVLNRGVPHRGEDRVVVFRRCRDLIQFVL